MLVTDGHVDAVVVGGRVQADGVVGVVAGGVLVVGGVGVVDVVGEFRKGGIPC